MSSFLGLSKTSRKHELRTYPRVPTNFPVKCTLGETTVQSRASTLGGGGMFIDESRTLLSGAEISVEFRPAKHLPFLNAKARVIYVQPEKGSGVEFTQISLEHQQLILRLIHHKTAAGRQSARVHLATQIHIQDSMALAFSRDVSMGGMFIETRSASDIGTKLDLRFHLEDGRGVIIATGEVRYLVPKLGMGIQFLEMSWYDDRRIQEFVAASAHPLPESTEKPKP